MAFPAQRAASVIPTPHTSSDRTRVTVSVSAMPSRSDAAAPGWVRSGVAARTHADEHPLEHHLRQRVTRREVPIAAQLDLALAVGSPRPRPAHRDAPAAERDF